MEENKQDKRVSGFLEEDKIFLEDLKQVDVEQNWERFVQSTSIESTLHQNYAYRQKNWFLIRIAAAVILLLLAIGTFYFTGRESAHQIIRASTETQGMDLTLSDGTAISLNRGATISYPEILKRRKREISLEGEAFFQVAPGARSPFIVHTDQWAVKVLGTSFNVKEDQGILEVGVVQGTVLVFEEGKRNQAIRVSAGEKCVCNASTGERHIERVQSENYLYWKTKKLIYRDELLAAVISELESYFGQRIVVTDSLILQNRWTSTHEDQDLSEILEEFCLYFDLKQISENDTIFLERK